MVILADWARTEREFLRLEIKAIKEGGKVISPQGDDVSKSKLKELESRLEGVLKGLQEIDNA